MSERALSPVVGVVVLLFVTMVLAGAAGASVMDLATLSDPPDHVAISARADAESGRITLTHDAGPPLDVAELTIKIEIDGRPLFHQPPVPFFAARGFAGAPTGPFNVASDPEWSVGETASVRLAGTNRPILEPGDDVTITIFQNDYRLAELRASAQ